MISLGRQEFCQMLDKDGLSRLGVTADRRLMSVVGLFVVNAVILLCLSILSTPANPQGRRQFPSISSRITEAIAVSSNNSARFQLSGLAQPLSDSGSYTMYLPIAMHCYALPLCNGDFEVTASDFAPCWERGGNLSVTITTTLSNNKGSCYSGTYCALLGSSGDQCNHLPKGYGQIYQTFGVPPTGTPKLSFWYRIFSYDERIYDKHGLDKRDTFEVYIDDVCPDDKPPIRLLIDGSQDGKRGCDKSDLDITPWRESPVFDLSAIPDGNGGSVDYRGKAVRLSFRVYSRDLPEYTGAWYNTWVYVDDVQIEEDP